jgi:hypothetical protein
METGVLVGNKFSPRQLKAIELFASGLNCTEVSRVIRVSIVTLSKWRRNDQFIETIYNRAKDLLKDEMPAIFKITKDKAKTGSYNHIKLLLEHLGNIEKKRTENSITFSWDIAEDEDSTPVQTV